MNIGMILWIVLATLITCAWVFVVLAATVFRKKWGHDIMG